MRKTSFQTILHTLSRHFQKTFAHLRRRFILEIPSFFVQIASVPVWELSTPRIWRPWAPEPVSLHCRTSGLSVYSWPVSPECCCHPSGLPESPPAGKASVDSGEKSLAPTAARQGHRKKIKIKSNLEKVMWCFLYFASQEGCCWHHCGWRVLKWETCDTYDKQWQKESLPFGSPGF